MDTSEKSDSCAKELPIGKDVSLNLSSYIIADSLENLKENVNIDWNQNCKLDVINSLISFSDAIISDLGSSLNEFKQGITVPLFNGSCMLEYIEQLILKQEYYERKIKQLREEIDSIRKKVSEDHEKSTITNVKRTFRSDDLRKILMECTDVGNAVVNDWHYLGSVDDLLEELNYVSKIDNFIDQYEIVEMIKFIKPDLQNLSNYSCKTAKLLAYTELICKILKMKINNVKEISVSESDNSRMHSNSKSLNEYCNNKMNRNYEQYDAKEKLSNIILIVSKYLEVIKSTYRNKHIISNLETRISERLEHFQLLRNNLNRLNSYVTDIVSSKNGSSVYVNDDYYSIYDSVDSVLNKIELGYIQPSSWALSAKLDSDELVKVFNKDKFKQLRGLINSLKNLTWSVMEQFSFSDKKCPVLTETFEQIKISVEQLDAENENFITDNLELLNEHLANSPYLSESLDLEKYDNISEYCKFSQMNNSTSMNLSKCKTNSKEEAIILHLINETINSGCIFPTTSEKYGNIECNLDKGTCTDDNYFTINANYSVEVDNALEDKSKIFSAVTDGKRTADFNVNMKSLINITNDIKVSFKTLVDLLHSLINEILNGIQSINEQIQISVKNAFESIMLSLECRNGNLLKDMLEMNEELKKRGERISHLNESNEEIERYKSRLLQQQQDLQNNIRNRDKTILELTEEIDNKNNILNEISRETDQIKQGHEAEINRLISEQENLRIKINELQNKLVEKETVINDLEQEISKRDNQDGDTSSMGTISRTEENYRLRDIEDSFEDRYNKLRALAVQMKKRIAELKQQIEIDRNNFSSEKTELQNKLTQLMPKAKLSQTLQSECDKLNDTLELKETEIKELKKIIKQGDDNASNLLEKISQLEKQLTESEIIQQLLKEDKYGLEQKLASVSLEVDKFIKTKSTNDSIEEDKNNEIQLLKQKINEQDENLKKIKNDYEQTKLELRKQGALSLEMRDYEKTITDLINQLASERNKIKELNEKITETVDKNAVLTEAVEDFEKQLIICSESNSQANEEIARLKKQLVHCEESLNERDLSLKTLTDNYELEKTKNSELKKQIDGFVFEQDVQKDRFEIVRNSLVKQVNVLQMELTVLKDQLRKKECDLERLNKDYENYKIRAQGILQKQKTENSTKYSENMMKQQINNLEKVITDLKIELNNNKNEIEAYKNDISTLEMQKEKLNEKNKELSNLIGEKSGQLEFLNVEFEMYKLVTEKKLHSYEDEIEKLSFFKNDVVDLREKYNESLAEIKSLEEKLKQFSELQIISQSSCSSAVACGNINTEKRRNIPRKDSDILSLPDNYSSSFSAEKSLPSLENILSNSKDSDDDDNLMKLKHQLSIYEDEIRNLRSSLRESENTALLTDHQVNVLKDEIRRLQRTIEREPHIKNTEYLKNVLMKFLTLQNGDEKLCLIPVLETMLKLSSEECSQLSSMAKDGAPTDSWSTWGQFLNWK